MTNQPQNSALLLIELHSHIHILLGGRGGGEGGQGEDAVEAGGHSGGHLDSSEGGSEGGKVESTRKTINEQGGDLTSDMRQIEKARETDKTTNMI